MPHSTQLHGLLLEGSSNQRQNPNPQPQPPHAPRRSSRINSRKGYNQQLPAPPEADTLPHEHSLEVKGEEDGKETEEEEEEEEEEDYSPDVYPDVDWDVAALDPVEEPLRVRDSTLPRQYFNNPTSFESQDVPYVATLYVKLPVNKHNSDQRRRGDEESSDGRADIDDRSRACHVVQPVQLYFHQSFSPSPDTALRLHFSKGSEVTAYRMRLVGGGCTKPEEEDARAPGGKSKDKNTDRLNLTHHGRRPLVNTAGSHVTQLFPLDHFRQSSTRLQKIHLRRYIYISWRQLLKAATIALLIVTSILFSLSMVYIIHGPSDGIQYEYHPVQHLLLANLGTSLTTYLQLPDLIPLDTAELQKSLLSLGPDFPAIDLQQTPLGTLQQPNLPLPQLLWDIGYILDDIDSCVDLYQPDNLENTTPASARLKLTDEVKSFQHHAKAAKEALTYITASMAVWHNAADHSLRRLMLLGTRQQDLFGQDLFGPALKDSDIKLVCEVLYTLNKLSSGSPRSEIEGLGKNVRQLQTATERMASWADGWKPTQQQDREQQTRTDSSKTDTVDYTQDIDYVKRQQCAVQTPWLLGVAAGLAPVLAGWATVLAIGAEELDALGRQMDSLAANVAFLRNKLPSALMLYFNSTPGLPPRVLVLGTPTIDGFWLQRLPPSSPDVITHLLLLHLPPPPAIHTALSLLAARSHPLGVALASRVAAVESRTHAWRTRINRDEVPLHSWAAYFTGNLATPDTYAGMKWPGAEEQERVIRDIWEGLMRRVLGRER